MPCGSIRHGLHHLFSAAPEQVFGIPIQEMRCESIRQGIASISLMRDDTVLQKSTSLSICSSQSEVTIRGDWGHRVEAQSTCCGGSRTSLSICSSQSILPPFGAACTLLGQNALVQLSTIV